MRSCTDQCQNNIAHQVRPVPVVLDVTVMPHLTCRQGTESIECDYGIAQTIFDPILTTSAKILARVKPPYWSDVITESPVAATAKSSMDERKLLALFA